jgi:hypothetical protein
MPPNLVILDITKSSQISPLQPKRLASIIASLFGCILIYVAYKQQVEELLQSILLAIEQVDSYFVNKLVATALASYGGGF